MANFVLDICTNANSHLSIKILTSLLDLQGGHADISCSARYGAALHDTQFTRIADMPNRRRLRSASSNQFDVPSFRLPTVGSRAFPIAGAKVWNNLPDDVTSAPSQSTFRRHLKTHLFRCCYNIL